jgi:K+-sensing histidine kinase KdpD
MPVMANFGSVMMALASGPPIKVNQIFEPFVSINRGTSHRGSGIGLSIAQSFCNAIAATIRYQPNQPHGACFVVRLHE